MKKLVLLFALVAFLGVSTLPAQATPDSPKTEQTKEKEKKAKTTEQSKKDCTTESSSCCKSKCDGTSKKKEEPQKK
jgi:peptidoglycan hydrolase CwlO-like protein